MLALPGLTVLSDSTLIQESIVFTLRESLADFEPPEAITIIVDAPLGSASELLPEVAELTVVVTNNLCPEYLDDLWDLGPTALITNDGGFNVLLRTLKTLRREKRIRIAPVPTSCLTPRERKVLHQCSLGLTGKMIANRLKIEAHSVQNYLTSIYSKLSVKNKEEAMLYYWGLDEQ